MGLLPSPHSSPPGKTKYCDEHSDDTAPCDDAFLNNNDDLNTQEMDHDIEIKTQPIYFDDETQIMDLAGETQVMDDYDFDENEDTQQIDLTDTEDCEGKSDNEDSQVTQPLDSTLGLMDVEVEDRNGTRSTTLGEKGTDLCHRDDGHHRTGSTPLDDVSQSSGCSKKGSTSVRSASLRPDDFAACQTDVKIANDRPRGTLLSNFSSDLHSFDNIGLIENCEKVGEENEVTKYNEEGLIDGDRSSVARSLAKKLFMGEDGTGVECDTDINNRSKELTHFPCDNNLAGLSYVDSQEPGELSQNNALEFVDRFLKFNMFETDQGGKGKTGVGETGIPGSISKGAQSIAQKATRRSSLAEPSIYEWDDNLEDEGGGEFFTKKKEVLLGHNSCPRPQSSQHRDPRLSQSVGKLRNKKGKQVVHDNIMGVHHSDLTSMNSGEKGKAKKRVVQKNGYSKQLIEALPSVQSADIQNVGIDTQMAAEAMEALSTVSALMNNDDNVGEQGRQSKKPCCEIEAVKDGPTKQSSHKKGARFSTSGVVTRSRTKGTIMKSGQEIKCRSTPQTRSRSIIGKLNVSPVKPNRKRNRSSIDEISVENRKEKPDTTPLSVGDKQKESIQEEQLNVDPPRQLKRQSLRGKHGILTPPVKEVCVEVVRKTRSKKRNSLASENLKNRKEDVDINTRAENVMVDGLNFKTMECSFRRTRSSRNSVHGTECSRDKRGSLSSRLLSLESTPPRKGTLVTKTAYVTPEHMQKSSNTSDVTPVHSKTCTSAVSPICIGDGYQTPSCKRRVSLPKECIDLISNENRSSSPSTGLRQRRDKSTVRVLFSQHLDGDIVRQQKKILYRLGVSVASTIMEATHFVADSFTRTRNMLEAIANGKPVVTHFWIENCGQANCIIDEKKYILRDAKKEKELGFSMPKSLTHATQNPLLEGRRVLITPNVKPAKEVISSLVKAVRGQAVERIGRSISNNDKLLDDLLVLSCEEDFRVSEPLLEKGIAVYSSELLLNGIITQRLEYERYRLFVSHVKKTRSTLWLKKGEEVFPVTKIK